MRVLEKFGGFGEFVATGLGGFEHVRRLVSLAAVRGRFDRFSMTPWNVCQNPSFYKKCVRLEQAAN